MPSRSTEPPPTGAEEAAETTHQSTGDGAEPPRDVVEAPPAPPRDRRASRLERELPRPPRRRTVPAGPDHGNGRPPAPPPPAPPSLPPAGERPRLKKLRFALVLLGLGLLALVSTVFGMMMAVTQDLPAIENFAQFKASQNSVLVDASGEQIGTLSSDQNKVLLDSADISANVKNAVVAVEDTRFYEHRGVDYQGIARAFVQDVLSRSAKQGASTITQQFVKNALEAQGNRTIFEKLREAALAYHLERRWSKDKILTEYLNTIYFGEGAYGIESAARTYFGAEHQSCGSTAIPCASVVTPAEAAMLAGLIASPTAYDPKSHPEAAKERRDLVLQRMHEQGYLTEEDYLSSVRAALPAPKQIEPPTIDSEAPYFTAWLRPQLVERYGAGRAFFGGLKIKTTLDLNLQEAAEDAVTSYLSGLGPTAAVVVIDNETGGVKAMVGGPDFEDAPFNLATSGHRQPGSSIKPFILVTALEQGISPGAVYESAPQIFEFGRRGKELFPVANYEDSYLGAASLSTATTYSDNSVYAQVGLESIENGPHAIAKTIHRMGYAEPISTNPAMVLGGLSEGVTPLGWTYAFSTLANDGRIVTGSLRANYERQQYGPIAYTQVENEKGDVLDNNKIDRDRVISEDAALTAKSILHTVVTSGTGTNANLGDPEQWGKTGTTENNGDAWFCGALTDVTACVWVGYPDSTTPMETLYNGGPVDGGTFPALIWASVMSAWEEIRAIREAEEAAEDVADDDSSTPIVPEETAPAAPPPSSEESESTDDGGGAPESESEPATPAPAPAPAPAAPAPAPSTGGGVSPG